MSNNTPRDTQFQNFAKLLLEEVHDPIADSWREDTQEVIARRAYDLVAHILKSADPVDLDTSGEYLPPDDQEVARRIANMPDMTEWPAESEKE